MYQFTFQVLILIASRYREQRKGGSNEQKQADTYIFLYT